MVRLRLQSHNVDNISVIEVLYVAVRVRPDAGLMDIHLLKTVLSAVRNGAPEVVDVIQTLK